MIDFRYHLVSIIAVFLALAVGLVVGSTALSPVAEDLLQKTENRLSDANNALHTKNGMLTQRVAADQAFAQASAHRLLDGLLAGEKVVLVVSPGADSSVTSGVTAALRQAGATVTGQVTLQPSFLITSGHNETVLEQLAQHLGSTAGLAMPAPSGSAVAGQQLAARVIAASLVTSKLGPALPAASVQSILSGFGQGGYLTVDATPSTADLAVLVAPGGPAPQSGDEVLVAVAQQLKAASSGTVLAGTSASIGSGSVISAENKAGPVVSTVDNADTEVGQIMVAQALTYLLAGKAPAAFGAGPGAAPSPAPTPTVLPSTTSTTAAGKH